MEAVTFAQLLAYMEDSGSQEGPTVFRLAELTRVYADRLKQLGLENSKRINSTHLKNRILFSFHDIGAVTNGRDVLLAFDEDVSEALNDARDDDFDARILAMAAEIVRRDLRNIEQKFGGTFDRECQKKSVPNTLRLFVAMILR